MTALKFTAKIRQAILRKQAQLAKSQTITESCQYTQESQQEISQDFTHRQLSDLIDRYEIKEESRGPPSRAGLLELQCEYDRDQFSPNSENKVSPTPNFLKQHLVVEAESEEKSQKKRRAKSVKSGVLEIQQADMFERMQEELSYSQAREKSLSDVINKQHQ